MSDKRLRIGFIPLCDATALIVAVDKGFAAAEGLDVELVREVSWSNVRDKLNIGLFDAAHLIAPVAIASSLGLGHVKVPIVAPFGLGVNGNAITVSPELYAALAAAADGNIADPMVSARALARVVANRKARGAGPAHLRHDVPVLDPQLSPAVLDGGRRRRSGRGRAHGRAAAALHGREPREQARRRRSASARRGIRSRSISASATSCISFPRFCRAPRRRCWRCARAGRPKIPTCCGAWCARIGRAAAFVEDPDNRDEVAAILAAPNRIGARAGSHPPDARRPLEGRARRHDAHQRPLSAGRPQGAPAGPTRRRRPGSTRRWCAGVRRRLSAEMLAAAKAVFRPDLYDAALPGEAADMAGEPADGIGAFAGPPFDPDDIERAPRGLEDPAIASCLFFALHKISAGCGHDGHCGLVSDSLTLRQIDSKPLK